MRRDIVELIQKSIDYVEENLKSEIEISDLNEKEPFTTVITDETIYDFAGNIYLY